MVEVRRRGTRAGAVVLGMAALIGIGFWIGRTNTAHPDILHARVTVVGDGPPVDRFAVELDGPYTLPRFYDLGSSVPWFGTRIVGHGTPPCVVVGHHVTLAVLHVQPAGDEVVWIDCGGDIGSYA